MVVVVVALGQLFEFTVRDEIDAQRNARPDTRLQQTRERGRTILETGRDPDSGEMGLPIDEAMDQLLGDPTLLRPADAGSAEVAP